MADDTKVRPPWRIVCGALGIVLLVGLGISGGVHLATSHDINWALAHVERNGDVHIRFGGWVLFAVALIICS